MERHRSLRACAPSSSSSSNGAPKGPRVPAFLRGRGDFTMQDVVFARDDKDDPLGLGLEHMGVGGAAESIVLDQQLAGSVVAASGVVQVGSLVHAVHGQVLVGRGGTAEAASFDALVDGIQSQPDVHLTLVRPTSLACLLTMVSALKEEEIDVMLKDADRRRCGGGASKASGSEHHALLRMFALPDQDAVDLSGWARRPVTLTRGPHGLGLGIVHLGLGTVMVDVTTTGRPAAAAHNIQVGSVIATIDGADVRGMDFEQVQAALGGASGTSVSLLLLQPHSLGSLLASFLTLQRMLIDDGCVEDYEWWQETAASDEDHDTWSERDGEDEEEEEDDNDDDADDEGASSDDNFDLAADLVGGARAAPARRQQPASPQQRCGSRSRSTSPCRSDDGGSQSDNPFEIVIEA